MRASYAEDVRAMVERAERRAYRRWLDIPEADSEAKTYRAYGEWRALRRLRESLRRLERKHGVRP